MASGPSGQSDPAPERSWLGRYASSDIGSRAVVNSVLVLGARALSKLVTLLVVIALANHLGAARYGRYTTLVAYSALVSVLADLGLNTLYTRETAREPSRQAQYMSTVALGKIGLSAVAVAVLALAVTGAGLRELVIPGSVLLVATTYANLLRNTFYARGRLELEVVAILAETAIQATGVLLGVRRGAGPAYFIWVYAASYGVTAIYCLLVLRVLKLGRLQLRFDPALFRRWLRLALPFALGFFLTNLYFRIDVPILQRFKPFQEVGWYQFAYRPFEALQFIPLAVQSVVYPVLSVYHRSSPERLAQAYQQFFKVLVLLGWPLTVGTAILAHPIARLFRLYPQSEPSLRILALAIVFLFVNSAFVAMLYSIDRQDLFAWATGLAVVINVVLNLALIPTYGYLAASATTVVTEAAFAVTGCWLVGRRHRLPWLRVSWRILLAGALMGAVLVPAARLPLLLAAPVGAVVYVLALWMLRAVGGAELELFIRSLRPARG